MQQQMDAVVLQASGPPAQALAYRPEPVPQPGPGETLVEVHAAAVNPLDVANAAGLLDTPLPMIPGVDYGLLAPPAIKKWPLQNAAEAYQTVRDGSAGIKQVLVPTGAAQGDPR